MKKIIEKILFGVIVTSIIAMVISALCIIWNNDLDIIKTSFRAIGTSLLFILICIGILNIMED